jgi:hypothetical protein
MSIFFKKSPVLDERRREYQLVTGEESESLCMYTPSKQTKTTNYSQMFFKLFFWTLGLCEDLLSFVAIFTNKARNNASATQQQPRLFCTHLLSVFPLLVVVVLFLTISRDSCRPAGSRTLSSGVAGAGVDDNNNNNNNNLKRQTAKTTTTGGARSAAAAAYIFR